MLSLKYNKKVVSQELKSQGSDPKEGDFCKKNVAADRKARPI